MKSTAEKIEDLEQNDLLNFRDLSAREYLNRIACNIDLSSLYSIHSASNFSQFDKYMAVQLKLGHQMRLLKEPKVTMSDDDPLAIIAPVKVTRSSMLASLTVSLTFCKNKIERTMNELDTSGAASAD